MICALCGPTDRPVIMRSFAFAGQTTYLVVCDACRDKANVELAKRESRAGLRSSLDVDVKAEPIAPRGSVKAAREKRRGRGNGGGLHFGRPRGEDHNPSGTQIVPGHPFQTQTAPRRKQPGAPDQKHIRKRH